MTITAPTLSGLSPLPTLAAAAPFTFTTVSAAPAWTQVGPNLWSAIQGTEFLGTIEYADYTFTACDHIGGVIGTYPTLDNAQAQVLHPTNRAYLARHRVSSLLPATPRTVRGRVAAAVVGLAAATAAAVSLLIGTHA